MYLLGVLFFFFKQKTAYEMRISDWSSDVCSSDLELAQMHSTRRRLDEVIEETRPDVIQAHSPVLNGIPALQAARRHRLPMVYEVRSLWEDAADRKSVV